MVMKKKQTTPSIFEKYRGYMKYFKHLKNLLEAHETYKKSQALQDELKQKQRELNYRLEHDRIGGELETADYLKQLVKNWKKENKNY